MTTLVQAHREGEANGLNRAAAWHERRAEHLMEKISASRGLPIERELCMLHNLHLEAAGLFRHRAGSMTAPVKL